MFLLCFVALDDTIAQIGSSEVDTLIARYRRMDDDSARRASMRDALRLAQAIHYVAGEGEALYDLGRDHFENRRYDSAAISLREALDLFRALGAPLQERLTINRLGVIQHFLHNCEVAIDHYREFLRLGEIASDSGNVALAHFNMGVCMEDIGEVDSAIFHYDRSRVLRRQTGDAEKELKVSRALASIYYDRDEFEEARNLLLSALRLDDGSVDSAMFTLIYFDLGKIAYRMADLVKALRYYQEAYARSPDGSLIDAYYQDVGLIYSAIDDHERAIDNYRQALVIRKMRRDSSGMAESFQAIGGSLLAMDRDSAEWYYDQALGILERNDLWRALSSLHVDMGYYYYVMDDFEPAKRHYRDCLAIGPRAETQADIYLARAYLGRIAQMEQDYDMAEDYLLEANAWFNDRGIKSYAMTTYGFLSDLYVAMGDFRRAFNYQQREKDLNQEILSARNVTEIAVLRYQMTLEQEEETARLLASEKELMYEADLRMERLKRNIAIASAAVALLVIVYILRLVIQRRRINKDLNRQNEQLNALAASLTETLHEKEILYKEIHHRVKNNLQIILSLLNSAQLMVKDEEAREVLQQSRNRVNSMALIHKHLYQSDNMERVDAHKYILEIVREIEHSFASKRGIAKIHTRVEDVDLELNLAIPVGLILNELVTNAFKYAFQSDRQNEMTIDLTLTGENSFRVVVQDNGPGLPEDFSPVKTETLGFQLIQGLTRQINGELTYHSNGGLRVQIDFTTS